MSAGRNLAMLGLMTLAAFANPSAAPADVIISISTSRLTPDLLALYGFDCDQLWMMRNGLYACNGYKFSTARGIQTFGTGGYMSNPVLTPPEHRNVAVIQQFERAKGCLD